jgi:hypothetical protein
VIVSLRRTAVGGLSGVGLLSALPVTYYAALGLLVVGFAVAVVRPRPHRVLLATYLIVLVVLLHATTAVLDSEPRYAWVYKHIGVIDYSRTTAASTGTWTSIRIGLGSLR